MAISSFFENSPVIRLEVFEKTFFVAFTLPEATFPAVDDMLVGVSVTVVSDAVLLLNGFIDASDIGRDAQPTEESPTQPPINIVMHHRRRAAEAEGGKLVSPVAALTLRVGSADRITDGFMFHTSFEGG